MTNVPSTPYNGYQLDEPGRLVPGCLGAWVPANVSMLDGNVAPLSCQFQAGPRPDVRSESRNVDSFGSTARRLVLFS